MTPQPRENRSAITGPFLKFGYLLISSISIPIEIVVGGGVEKLAKSGSGHEAKDSM